MLKAANQKQKLGKQKAEKGLNDDGDRLPMVQEFDAVDHFFSAQGGPEFTRKASTNALSALSSPK
jgi:hypothetical protein